MAEVQGVVKIEMENKGANFNLGLTKEKVYPSYRKLMSIVEAFQGQDLLSYFFFEDPVAASLSRSRSFAGSACHVGGSGSKTGLGSVPPDNLQESETS